MTTSSPSVKITSLPYSLLRFPPDSRPQVLPPPSNSPAFAHPFSIPPNVYNALLDVNVPITIALLYMTSVTYLNRYNAQRNQQPWSISKTRLFFIFVIIHNVFLALYSAWTCLGMINAIKLSFPGWRGPYGLAGVVDSFCKINGPRGLGAAATFEPNTSSWSIADKAMHLAANGLAPESSDIGRIWNEGLAFYGWLFYLSKFYEVLDTFIILAKGKKSSFLQTYHHAGAMMCMWAGIRYMAPPIWMFVLVNSGLHALMYTYYTLTALSIKVPTRVKKVLTTLQIIQFVIGASFAFAHLFIAYTIPVSVSYTFSLADLTSVASPVTTDAASPISTATATASAGAASWIKKLAFRAAGREGLAENVVNEQGETFGVDAVRAAEDLKAREEIRYRDELQWIHCTDTSGQTFAILLNCMYLAPLTFLFVKFFIRAYSKRLERRRSSIAYNIEQSTKDAFHGVARQAVDAIGDMHGTGEGETISTEEAIKSSQKAMKEQAKSVKKSLSEGLESAKQSAKQGLESAQKKGKGGAESAKQSSEGVEAAQKEGKGAAESAKQSAEQGVESAQKEGKGAAESAKQSTEQGAESAQKEGKEAAESAKQSTEQGAESAQKKGKDVAESSKQSAEQKADSAEQEADSAGQEADSAEQKADSAEQEADSAEQPAKEDGEAAEESSTSETAATTEPMAEGGDLSDSKTELHKEGLQ